MDNQNNANKTQKPVKPKEKSFSEAEVQAMIAKAVAEAMAKATPQTTILQVAEKPKVNLLLLDTIAEGTSVALPKLGTITKSGNVLTVDKDLFLSSLGVPVIDALLAKRNLIVIDGLDDEERERYGLKYEEGELISKKGYFNLFKYSKEQICDIFTKLCDEHKRIVATLYATEYFENNSNLVNPDTVKELNALSKTEKNPKGMFFEILDDMGAKFAD